jgi:beta-glucanase (GH16 family)
MSSLFDMRQTGKNQPYTRIIQCLLYCALIIPAPAAAGEIRIEGRESAILFDGSIQGGTAIQFELEMQRYPLARGRDPGYEAIINPPVITDRIRLVSRDQVAHVTEIRLFEEGMPEYPPVMGGGEGGLDLPNFARGATVTASSRWADERHESNVVDDDIGFESRWVSGGSPPHHLEIKLDRPRSIGCIQMVSGYPSGNEWVATAVDFHFEYDGNGQWKAMPGSGGTPPTEPSRLAIVLRGEDREYRIMHRQERENWVVVRTDESGGEEVYDEFEFPQHDIREGLGFDLNIQVARDTATLVINGMGVLTTLHSLGEEVQISIESLSSYVAAALEGLKVETPGLERSTMLNDVIVKNEAGERMDFVFNPWQRRQEFAIPDGKIPGTLLEIQPGVEGQSVSLNAQERSTLEFDASQAGDAVVEVTVRSMDGEEKSTYEIALLGTPPSNRYVLAFSDEFEGEEVDFDKWFYRLGQRWNSRQRPENVRISDGRLIIDLEVDSEGNQFTGGIITNEAFGYGYYETSARLWKHRGWHSAFWQMQASGVRVNEIDGFESVSPNSFSTNLQHYRPRNILGAHTHYADVAGRFNTFAWEWLPNRVRFYFNGELIREDLYPGPHLPQHVWLGSVARADASVEDLPGTVEFEYFRYYKPVHDLAALPDEGIVWSTKDGGYHETGTWEDCEYAVSHRGEFSSRISRTPGSSAKWAGRLPESGDYEVFVWNAYVFPDGNRTRANYLIEHAEGSSQSPIKPMLDGQRWVSLGTFTFSADTPAVVRLDVKNSQPHRADAVMFHPVNDVQKEAPKHVLHVDATAQRVIRLGAFEKSELDREIYFRTYHPPGIFTEEMDRALKEIGATPGRGTAPYFAFDTQHSYGNPIGGQTGRLGGEVGKPQRTDFSGDNFEELVEFEIRKWVEVYAEAEERFPGLRHALSVVGAYPEAMRRDNNRALLGKDYYEDFSALVVELFDRLKAEGGSLPTWFTTENEPHWTWGADAFTQYSVVMARAMADSHPDVKIAGPCSAWPYPQSDWRRWNSWERKFIEGAGRYLGAYDLHLYSKGYWAYTDERLMGDPRGLAQSDPSLHSSQRSGCATVWDYGRADGLLDLFVAHHMGHWNEDPKPMIISEFGRQGIEPQLGPWENEFKPWLYMTTVTRLWMSFMERPEVELTIPFITGVSCMDYGAARGQAVYNRPGAPEDRTARPTRFRDFYLFFRDLQGARIRANLAERTGDDGRDISVRAFAEGEVLYLLLHNGNGYPEGNATIRLDIKAGLDTDGKGISVKKAGIKRLRWEGPVPQDHTASNLAGSLRIDTEYGELDPGELIELAGEETAIVRLNLSAEPTTWLVNEYVDFSRETVLDPDSEGICRMTLNVPDREGELLDATLWLSLARDGGFANNPVVRFNGRTLSDIDVTFSEGITDFHRPIEIPLDTAKLNERNEIEVRFGPEERREGNVKVVTAKIVTSRKADPDTVAIQ